MKYNKVKSASMGKIILFGEHFVVYGKKGIVMPLTDCISVELEFNNGEKDIIKPAGWNNKKTRDALNYIKNAFNIRNGLNIRINELMPSRSGLGSSAAFCVALVKALYRIQGIGSDGHKIKEEINRHAYEMEKFYHGNPSGIDNTASVYEKAFIFEKGKRPILINNNLSLDFVICILPREKDTKSIVQDVKALSESKPFYFDNILSIYDKIFDIGLYGIKNRDKSIIGNAMNMNQEILADIGVSNKNIEMLRHIALDNGCYGAKLSGAGRGGAFISLCKNRRHAEIMGRIFKKHGIRCFLKTLKI
ncbi:MAG: mevalonate kinase [Candidatus Anstonellales archaeon]